MKNKIKEFTVLCFDLKLVVLITMTILSIAATGNAKIPDFPLNYAVNADMRVVEMGPVSEEDILAEGESIVPFEPLGIDRGANIGVGLAPGVRCIEEKPMGDDDLLYCKPDSQTDKKRRKRLAKDLVVLTTKGVSSDAHRRFLRSANIFGYDIKVLSNPDGNTQLQLLRDAVDKINRETPNKLVLFIDGPNVVLSSGPLRVVEEFEHSESKILFSGDGIFTGKTELENDFPKTEKGRRFLDSGAFVGSSEAIETLLKEFPDEQDLQTLMSKAYTKTAFRSKHNLKIDHTSALFQNLNGATADLELRFVGKEAYLQNTLFSTVPVVIRASNHTIPILNNFGSYIARAWNEADACRDCWEDMISLSELADDELPIVTLAVFIEKPTPFMEEFLQTVKNISYPKNRIHFYLHNSVDPYKEMVESWLNQIKEEFKQVKYISPEDKSTKEWHAKNGAMDYCLESECTHVFFMDSEGMLDNPHALKLLIEQNRKVVAPLLPRPGKAWSNFWGALTSEGFYARSADYLEITQNQRRGLWNVPYVGTTYLVQRSVFEDPKTRPTFINNLLEADMAFCHNLRNKGIFMYVSNRVDMGHMLNSENFNPTHINPELWQMFDNRWDWERRYLHVNYSQSLNTSIPVLSPCPDVFWFPVFTERFSKEMIEMTEGYGDWSDGSHEDKRLDGGYESVPTVDIHMNQVAFHDEWMELLRAYVQPLQLRVFEGYYNDVGPPRALMAFAVRYKPDEQPSLRPHHDTSTYTINVGLNRPGIDFQGGGCRFIRYNCSVVDTRVGWMLMHPGRLTHLHEGLTVTNGTRYIIVTFVDP